MLPQDNRLRLSWEFRRARNRGRSWASPVVVLHVLRRPGSELRIGIAASKRVGKAVVRNRVKRLLREGLRANLGRVRPGHDLILTARPPAATASYGEIRQTIQDLLKRSGLLQEPSRHA